MGRKSKRKQWKAMRASNRKLRRRLSRLRKKQRGQIQGWTPHLWERSKVKLPEVLSLITPQAHLELTTALENLRSAFSEQGSVCLDFSATRQLFPAGTLLLWAELTRLIDAFPAVELSCIPSSNLKVSHVLQHLGIYGLLGYTAPEKPEGDDVLPWKKTRGTRVDVQQAGALLEGDPNFSMTEARHLFGAVSEAVTNVSHHAHLAERLDGLQLPSSREWWLFHKVDNDRLFIAICDLGIGIPRSLPRVHTAEHVREVLARLFPGKRATDGRMIKAALRIGRTRTGEENRGLGFHDILGIIDAVEGSQLFIFSNRGGLTYKRTPSSQSASIKTWTFKNSILGTILVWSFPLRGAEP